MFKAISNLFGIALCHFALSLAYGQSLSHAQVVITESRAPVSNTENNDWPRWRGANYNGASTQQCVFGENSALKIVWKRKLGAGYSAISIAHGHAITMFSDGAYDYLISLDPDSGNEQWRYRIDTTYPGRDGSNGGPVSTPAINGETVVGLGPKGQLFALDLKTGKRRWSTHLVEEHQTVLPHWGFTTSPLVYGDLVIVETGGTQNNAITAFNKKTGQVVWSAGTDMIEYQSPLIANIGGRTQLIWAGEKSLFGFEPNTGKALWQYVHGGDGFYRRIVNPVVVAGDRLLLTNRREQAKLIQIRKAASSFTVEEVWSTPQLKLNYNIPVYHEGYIYGYSSNFLVCVEANSGALKWKSRPPGNGFTILVEGYLVIMTKKGSLHVAKASPEGYVEIASQNLFDKLTWTPPSFANGKIYVRNSFDEIACLAVINGSSATANASRLPERLFFADSEFGKFVQRVEASADKRALIEAFLKSQSRFPVIEGDSLVHIVYYGEARDLALRGDMFEAGEEIPLRRISGTDFHYASFKLEPDARVTYQLVKDLEQRMADPRNPQKVNTVFLGSEASEIYMPGSEPPRRFNEPASGPRGKLDTLTFTSEKIQVGGKIWGGERRIQVYLPPDYATTSQRYPVIYINDGDNALEFGKMKNALDNLIGQKVQPVIAVFIQSISPYEFARSQREVYAKMVAEKLVPFIDERYRTIAKPEARAIWGGDEGGYSAFYLGFHYPEVFGQVAGQSVLAIAEGGPELVALVQNSSSLPLTLYLDWGKYDYKISSYGYDVRQFSRRLVEVLRRKKYQVAGGEVNEGSDFPSWCRRTDKILQAFFPKLASFSN